MFNLGFGRNLVHVLQDWYTLVTTSVLNGRTWLRFRITAERNFFVSYFLICIFIFISSALITSFRWSRACLVFHTLIINQGLILGSFDSFQGSTLLVGFVSG